MIDSFTHTTLGRTGLQVCRLGLSATYRPGPEVIRRALDAGVNLLFCYGFDSQVTKTVRLMHPSERQRVIVATGAYNLLIGHPNLRRTLEKRLRQLGSDYIDIFLFLGVTKPKHLTDHVRDELLKFRQEGKVRFIGMSGHDRGFHAEEARRGDLDVLMLRYNAAHRGAETDIFPRLNSHNPGVLSYTATRWGFLLRRTRGWPKDGRIPTASDCYRFVLSNPHVHVCLTAPSNRRHLEENLSALEAGPLSPEDHAFMVQFGDAVHHSKKWFM